jgi:hypothetical protein
MHRFSTLDDLEGPDLGDVLIEDINDKILDGDLSDKLGQKYLSLAELNQKPVSEAKGLLYGAGTRAYFTFPTMLDNTSEKRAFHVHYLFDSGSPTNYMSLKVSENQNSRT